MITCNSLCKNLEANWQKMFIIFQVNGQSYKLQGISQPYTKISIRSYDGIEIVRWFEILQDML